MRHTELVKHADSELESWAGEGTNEMCNKMGHLPVSNWGAGGGGGGGGGINLVVEEVHLIHICPYT